MTDEQIRMLKVIFIALDALIDSSEEASCVLIRAAEILKCLGYVPDYEVMCKMIDEIWCAEERK